VAADVIAYHEPEHPVVGEYRLVRDEARRQLVEQGPRVLVFTAARPAAGTTTVILNLAVALTEDGPARVLVVDANFDRPAAAGRLGASAVSGLAEALAQTIPLAWAVQPTVVPKLHVLACGVPTDGTAQAMNRDLPRLLTQLRQWFDWVLVDAGVWGDVLGAEVLGPASDAVYLVTRDEHQERSDFLELRSAIAAVGGNPRGYVTTRR
jgi:Mrp family chromosome partitioning ATPase